MAVAFNLLVFIVAFDHLVCDTIEMVTRNLYLFVDSDLKKTAKENFLKIFDPSNGGNAINRAYEPLRVKFVITGVQEIKFKDDNERQKVINGCFQFQEHNEAIECIFDVLAHNEVTFSENLEIDNIYFILKDTSWFKSTRGENFLPRLEYSEKYFGGYRIKARSYGYSYGKINEFNVLLHENGHSIGLNHTEGEDGGIPISIMSTEEHTSLPAFSFESVEDFDNYKDRFPRYFDIEEIDVDLEPEFNKYLKEYVENGYPEAKTSYAPYKSSEVLALVTLQFTEMLIWFITFTTLVLCLYSKKPV